MTKKMYTLLLLLFTYCYGITESEQKPIVFVNKSGKELFIVQQKTMLPCINIQQSDSCINTVGVMPIAKKINICKKADSSPTNDKQVLYSIDVTDELPDCIEIYEDNWKSGNIHKNHVAAWTSVTVSVS